MVPERSGICRFGPPTAGILETIKLKICQLLNKIFFLKYLTHNFELYIKQKLLHNSIWNRNCKILPQRKLF